MRLVLGVGLGTDASYDELRDLCSQVLAGRDAADVVAVATIDGRAAHPALAKLAVELSAEVHCFPAAELSAQPVPSPSVRVAGATGTPSVAEAAVLACGADLVVPKTASALATAALGVLPASGYDSPDRDVVHRVLADRRDVRRGFLPVPVDHAVLERVLESAHRAPSVGLSQPWDFLLISDLATRRRVQALAAAERQAFADALPADRRGGFDGLKVEAILESPLNIVVTCDPDRGGRHVLGRHADPRTAAFSAAIAVQNLWLAARAEGVGVGWVSFFEPEAVAEVLGLPRHVEVIAYLCVGYVDEFGATPELVRSGWADRRPLSWAVHGERWGERALPGGAPVSIVDDLRAAGELPDRPRVQSVRVLVTDAPRKPSAADELVVVVADERPGISGVFWRSARSTAEAAEQGVELLRDLVLQGVGEIEVVVAGEGAELGALADGVRLAARTLGLRRRQASAEGARQD